MVQQVIHLLGARPEQCYHWSTHSGAELDLLILAGNRRYGFEVKRSEAPRLTASMRGAFETLGLERLYVVHAGTQTYHMAAGIRALPAGDLTSTSVLRRNEASACQTIANRTSAGVTMNNPARC